MNPFPLRYAGWMAFDLARGPALPMLLLCLLAVFLQVSVNGTPLWSGYWVSLAFVLLGSAGIVSNDFFRGYHRVLFTKPLSPPLYYLLRWLLGAAVVALAVLIVDAGVALRLGLPMQGLRLVMQAELLYVLLGGLVFLLSTVTRRDWVLAVVLMIGQSVIGEIRSVGFWSGRLWTALYTVLPPFHLTRFRQPVTWGPELAHAALYGLGLVLVALIVLHRRPLGSRARD